ncbi:ATP-binding protein [Methanocella conradii]|uniref:ATP-binding protein n=1 Tax=Methanocella conradii TaxID=1175444 RepID=UPI0024B3BE2A|nr:DUF87 domain-containing protein [Methanocella conradii]MDI6898180.1 DUF87 domain-containing protein [Methanocella conradii]
MSNIKEIFDRAERIGVIGSPSSTSGLTIDILGTAVNKRLVGNLSIFKYVQDSKDHYALGQITEIIMENVWTQDPTMKGIIRQKGRVYPITERQDVHKAHMQVSSVFSINGNKVEPSILGTVPSTGTSINLLDRNIMDSLMEEYKKELFYLGRAYSTNILMPMWFKHFGTGEHGAGEAYHIGVFGKTGSGKSILATMMMLGYAKNKNMSIFVLDPQGQFSKEFIKQEMKEILTNKLSRNVKLLSLHNLVLSDYKLFKKVLIISNFLRRWCNVIHQDNQDRAAEQIINILKGKIQGQQTLGANTPPWKAYTREAFDNVWKTVINNEQVQRAIYSSQDGRQAMITAMRTADLSEVYDEWKKIANLFAYENKSGSILIKDIVKSIVENPDEGKILIIDLSETSAPEDIFWNEEIKYIVIGEFLSQLIEQAKEQYKKEKLLNTLVILDEAHRLAPRDDPKDENLNKVKATLIDAVLTTRKYGLGWMFISQTLSSLDKDIINQIRIFVFGFGLAWGIEQRSLEELIGGNREAIHLYQMFKDPQSGMGEKEYSFMTIGPISPLSFSGTPLFFTALKYPDEFLDINFG